MVIYMIGRDIDFPAVSKIFRLYFRTVLMVLFVFILLERR